MFYSTMDGVRNDSFFDILGVGPEPPLSSYRFWNVFLMYDTVPQRKGFVIYSYDWNKGLIKSIHKLKRKGIGVEGDVTKKDLTWKEV